MISKTYQGEVKCGGCNYRVSTLHGYEGTNLKQDGLCAECFLETGPDTPCPDFTHEDWAEVYYALDGKLEQVKRGDYGEEARGERKWKYHLAEIIDKLEIFFGEHNITY